MAVTFGDLCRRNAWPEIEKEWFLRFRGKERYAPTMMAVLQELSSLEPEKPDWKIQLGTESIDENSRVWVNVTGYNPGDASSWGIQYCDWCEWLGADVNSKALVRYSEPQIIVHCLWEMTWAGFTRADVLRSLEHGDEDE